MRISFSPHRRDYTLEVHKQGDVLTINAEAFDFSDLPNGATIPDGTVPCPWIVGPVERINGGVSLTLLLPHGPNPSQAVAFPETLVNPANGKLAIPFDPPPEPETIPEPEADDVDA